jgi:hypothetical protein
MRAGPFPLLHEYQKALRRLDELTVLDDIASVGVFAVLSDAPNVDRFPGSVIGHEQSRWAQEIQAARRLQ